MCIRSCFCAQMLESSIYDINLADPYKNEKVDVLHFYEVYTSLICLAYQIAPFRVKHIE